MSGHQGLPRLLHVALALTALIIAAPVLVLVAIAVALASPGPVLFRHERVGRNGRRFTLLKFRTMYAGGTAPQVTASDDARITPLGRIVRKTKVDELPEFWNVIRGDMSLVGPRPEGIRNVDLSDALWQEILRVRPGITDPTTLRLRNEEELLASAGQDPDVFYRRFLVPYKLRGYPAYQAERTWKSDLTVIWRTAVGVFLPARHPPPALEEIVSSSGVTSD